MDLHFEKQNTDFLKPQLINKRKDHVNLNGNYPLLALLCLFKKNKQVQEEKIGGKAKKLISMNHQMQEKF